MVKFMVFVINDQENQDNHYKVHIFCFAVKNMKEAMKQWFLVVENENQEL